MPTFKQLDAFVALADAGSISAASRRLGIAQSAASKHVSEFESLFPRSLLDRNGRRAELTVHGAEVLMRCRVVLARRDSLLAVVSRKELPLRRLRLGVTEVVALTWLNVFLQALRSSFPNVEIALQVEVSVQLRQRLRAGELDAVIVPDSSRSHGLFTVRLGSIENHWYCSPMIHPGRKILRPEDLARFDLLSQGTLARSGVPLEDWLRDAGIAPRSIISSSSLLAVIDLMVAGMGIAHLPEPLVRDLLARRLVAQLKVQPRPPAVDYVLLARDVDLSHSHRRLIEVASAACDFGLSAKDAAITQTGNT